MRPINLFLLACLMLPILPVGAEEDTGAAAAEKPEPEARVFTSEHEIRIDGARIRYTRMSGHTSCPTRQATLVR